jgi:hypothetical protein
MLTAIKEIVNPDVVLNIATGDKRLTLKEQAADSKIKKLHIENVPEDAFAFTLDYQPGKAKNRWFNQLSCYVNTSNNKGINKGCDLVLFVPQEDNHFIVLIFDLKSKKPTKKDVEKQLLNSELYVRYLIAMIKHHYDVDTESVEYKRTIVTISKKINKRVVYMPNDKASVINSFHTETVHIKRKEAKINLGALIK